MSSTTPTIYVLSQPLYANMRVDGNGNNINLCCDFKIQTQTVLLELLWLLHPLKLPHINSTKLHSSLFSILITYNALCRAT